MNSIYITFDVDWACDEVLAHTLDIVEQANIKSTFFITHETPLLARMRNNPNIELGIHPNFHKLFIEKNYRGNAETILEDCLQIVPEAKSIRTHCLVQSSYLFNLYAKYGLTHEVSLLIPQNSNINLQPFWLWNGLLRVPYAWEDDVHCINIANGSELNWNVKQTLDREDLKIFDFHPIHLYLNTENLTRYENSRLYHRSMDELRNFVNNKKNEGSFVFLKSLIYEGQNRDLEFSNILSIGK